MLQYSWKLIPISTYIPWTLWFGYRLSSINLSIRLNPHFDRRRMVLDCFNLLIHYKLRIWLSRYDDWHSGIRPILDRQFNISFNRKRLFWLLTYYYWPWIICCPTWLYEWQYVSLLTSDRIFVRDQFLNFTWNFRFVDLHRLFNNARRPFLNWVKKITRLSFFVDTMSLKLYRLWWLLKTN